MSKSTGTIKTNRNKELCLGRQKIENLVVSKILVAEWDIKHSLIEIQAWMDN